MKLALIFLAAFVVLSHQQFQLPRGMIWASPYVQQYKQSFYYGPDEDVDIRPLRRQYRPSIPVAYIPNEDLNVPIAYESQDDVDDNQFEFNGQSRIKSFKQMSNVGRQFYGSTFNNPFYRTATFTITSTVTTFGSFVPCVPSNNLAAIPSPTCTGRKKRESEDFENQFPIVPSKTLELIPTALPSSIGQSGQLMPFNDQQNVDGSLIRTVESSPEIIENNNSRGKRLFDGRIASTTLTSYSFIGIPVTSTVILDPTGANVALCLPAGYVVC